MIIIKFLLFLIIPVLIGICFIFLLFHLDSFDSDRRKFSPKCPKDLPYKKLK